MGMSASQARLIQLTARMSDLELEGQQINQERLNVSNQINTISEQALRVPIPTAPNPQEYMTTGYVGTDGDGKTVGLEPDGNGGFRVSTETPAVMFGKSNEKPKEVGSNDVAKPEANNTITARYKKEVSVHCWQGGTESKQITDADYKKKQDDVARKLTAFKAANKNKETAPVQSDFQKNNTQAYNEAYTAWNNSTDPNKGEAPKQADYQMNDTAAFNAANTAYNAYTTAKTDLDSYKESEYFELETTATGEVTSSNGDAVAANYAHAHGINATGDPEAVKYTFTDAFGKVQTDKSAEDLQNASSGYSSDQITALCKLYKDDGSQITVNDFDKNSGALKYDGKLYSAPAKEKIGDKVAYTYKEAEEKLGADFIKKLKYTIKAELPANDSLKDSQIEAKLENYRFTQEGGQWVAYKITDAGAVKYGETINGVSFDENKTSGRGRFSNSGVLTGVTYTDANGNEVTVKAKKQTELDEVKYGEAMADYENKKAEYDHIQEEFNQESKKWQQIDKQLELKLKRLDTERNSLNTEIDAVKKVIQDNTDKSFKTFSG